MKLKQFIFAFTAMLSCFAVSVNAQVAKVGDTEYATIEAAFAAATEGQTITVLVDATPVLSSQRAITKAAVIDLGGKTMTLTEDDLYFGTTTFKNGTIVVDPSVKPSTAVFWMFANQTLTFDNVKIVATGVTGTYLIGLDGNNSDLNLLNGSEIVVENTSTLDLDIICVNASTGNDIKVENSKVNVTNLDGRVFFRGNYTVKDSEVNLAGITKAGFRIEAGQKLSIEGTSVVNIAGEPRDGGIHLTDLTATYTKAETATVNATVNRPAIAKIGDTPYYTFAEAVAAAQNGETITLIDNVVLAERVTIPADKTLTIDLNGKSISMEESIIATAYAINNLGNLTITDGAGGGSINARGIYNGYGDGAANVATAKIIVLSGTINAKGTNGGAAIFNYGVADIQGGNFTSIGGYSLNSQSGASMTIADGVTANNGIYASGTTLVVNGGEINGNRSGCHVLYAWNSAVTINGGTFYNYNSGNSTIMSAGTSEVTINGGTISIKDGRVPGNGNTWTSCLTDAANTAKIIVNGGTFNGGVRVQGGATMTINGGSFNDVTGSGYNVYTGAIVEVKGGTFTDAAAQTFAKNNIAAGYELGENGTVKEVTPAAVIGTQKFPTLQAAIEAVKEGETIVVLDNITFTTGANGSTNGISYTRGVNFTLDLNGKTITSNLGNNALRFKIGDGNTVTGTEVTVNIKNGKIVSGANNWCAISAATADNSGNKLILNLTDLTIEANKAGDFAVKSWAGAVVNTNNVDVTSNYAGGFYACGGEIVLDANSSVAQKGLHTAPYLSYAFGISSGTGKMTINGGAYSAAPAAATDANNQGASHGSSVGGVMSSGGTLIINDGTFSNDNFGDAAPTAPRSLIMADAGAKVEINGGTFNAMAKIVDPTNNTGVASKNAEVTIKGGTYSADPTDAPYNLVKLAEGYIAVENNGVWTVERGLAGAGTEAEPYLINNVSDLKFFRDEVNKGVANKYNDPGVWVALGADIDLSGENWVGIGSATADHGFMGNFDGKNFTIKNLTITDPAVDTDGYAYAGLFGVTEGTDKNNQNTIKNLTIENVTIKTTGAIAAAAIAYPYYTIIDNVKVCGDIKIQGGDYTAGVLAYTRRCVNASNLSIVGNDGSFVKGNITVGGVISDIQTNGGLTADYKNFSAEGLTISGEKSVGGISGIICKQTLDGATVKNVTLVCNNASVGIVSGSWGDVSTISNVIYENVTGATAIVGATWKEGNAVEAKIGNTYYATLEDALAAKGNEVVELLVPYVVAKGETVTLDLNDKTVTGTPSEAKAYAVITNYGTLTISNGSVICNHTLAGSTGYAVNTITNCGTLTIEDATIENKSTAQYQIGYAIDNNSTSADAVVNIKSGKVVASGSSYYDGIRQFCNSQTKENSVVVSGGEVSTIWMQNPSDGGTKNTKDVKGSIAISGGKVGVLSLEPSANFEAAVTGGHFGEISYFQTAEGRDLKGFITGGTFDKLIDETFLAMGYKLTGDAAPYTVAYTGEVTELVLVDGEVTEFVNEKEITVGTLTYKRSNIKNTWTPFYVPFAVPVSALADKFDVAYINDVRRTDSDDDGELDKFSMEIIYIHGGNANGSAKTLKANYPYFIRSKSGVAEMEITLTDAKVYAKENVFDCTTMTEKFEIKGNYHQIPSNVLTENDYVVGGGEWHPLADGCSLNPFRFYMTKSSRYEDEPAAPMQSMRIIVCGEEDENGATIIYDVVEDSLNGNGNDFIYDLQGRRVSEPKKGGIYIKNGKKILF